jgi:hypothetical protein
MGMGGLTKRGNETDTKRIIERIHHLKGRPQTKEVKKEIQTLQQRLSTNGV